MKELIMNLCSGLFIVLFSFILFTFIIFLISKFTKKEKIEYEPNISIIIPAYNEEKNITACLKSIYNSDYPKEKIEIIAVDDGSTDKTIDKIKVFEEVKILNQDHKGKSQALNLGTKKSKYDIIMTIDADTTLEKNCITELVKPLIKEKIGASTGTSKVKNKNNLLTIFQNVEYHYNNLIRKSFSSVFKNGIWFFGALACYKKDAIKKIGYFKKDTLTEDMDIALELYNAGYKTLHVHDAFCHTIVPSNIKTLYSQRKRWWMGVLQALVKNRKIIGKKTCPSIAFLYINQFWWSIYAFLSLPVIIYQVNYWLPYNMTDFMALFSYLFRWFSLAGPFYVLYKIPEWGLTLHNFFGVFSGIISSILIISAILTFKDKINFKNGLALFFYFPYTIALNMMILLSLLNYSFTKKRFFIR